MNKYCIIVEVKAERIEDYIKLHKEPWREMLEAIRESGIKDEIIFFHRNQSIIILECEDNAFCDAKLRATEVCKKWDELTLPWFESTGFEQAEMIFDLNKQLAGKTTKL